MLLVSIVTTLGLIVTCAVHAQAPASAPAGTTGQCKDGTWYSGASKKGACHGHQGVKEWYGAADASTGGTSTAGTSTTKSTAKTTSTTPAATSSSSKDTHAASTTSATSTTATGTPPADATGLCNDGTYYTGASKKGACHGHKGVKTWYGTASTTSASTTAAAMPAAKPAPAAMPAATPPTPAPAKPAMTPATTPTTTHTTAATGSPAPGGGVGKVWVNTSSKVYHCQGDRYYGATKEGEYMSEADAIAKGNRAAHGKSCSS